MLWECEKGHQWHSTYTNIQSGHWCPKCAILKSKAPRTVSLSDAELLAKKHNGRCLSSEYVNSNDLLLWECEYGHQWTASYSTIKSGRWCKICAGKEIMTIEIMQNIAKERNGKCLSNKYINANQKLKWQCEFGHVWEARASHVKAGSWCPECSKPIITLEKVKALAKEKNGRCLSLSYENSHKKLKWECSVGHIWEASYANIYSGKWCPKCNSFQGERLCRIAFESIFSEAFPKSYPTWLKTGKNTQLELVHYFLNTSPLFNRIMC